MPAAFRAFDDQRRLVEEMSGYGVPQDSVATILDIDPKTLRKHFRRELDVGEAKANAKVGQTLFQQCMNGNTTALIFWLKARAGWRETIKAEVSGPNGDPLQIVTTYQLPSNGRDAAGN